MQYVAIQYTDGQILLSVSMLDVHVCSSKKVKASHTRHWVLGLELIPVYRQSGVGEEVAWQTVREWPASYLATEAVRRSPDAVPVSTD